MNTDEINRAIAEHLGWEDCFNGFGTETRYKGTPSEVRVTVPYPRYSKDLNAMHEAENTLTDVQCLLYPDNMREVITEHEASKRMWHATAHQRAEAFLRTIGKWRDS